MNSPARPPRSRYAHPPQVYRRRRLIVLSVLILAIWGVVKLAPVGDGPASEDTAPVAAEPTASQSTDANTPAPRAKRSEDKSRDDQIGDDQSRRDHKADDKAPDKRKDRTVRVRLRPATGKCDLAKVRVDPSVDDRAHAHDSVPIRLQLGTTAAEPCTLQLSSKNLLVEVDDQDDVVWESAACAEIPKQTLTLQPTWSTAVRINWSGRESEKNCDDQGDFVPTGKYTVRAAVLGGEPGKSPFKLAKRPEPKGESRDKPKHEDASKGKLKHDDEPKESAGDAAKAKKQEQNPEPESGEKP